MKRNLLLPAFAICICILFCLAEAAAQSSSSSLELRNGETKTHARSKMKIKFLEVAEDSRCPIGLDCVWAGNARIKIRVTNARGAAKIFEANTGEGSKGGIFKGWSISLVSLTPHPIGDAPMIPENYRAKFSIKRR